MLRLSKAFILIALCAALSACLQVDQSLKLSENGQADLHIIAKVEAALIQMSNSADVFCPERAEQVGDVAVSAEMYADGSMQVCDIRILGHIDHLADFIESGGLSVPRRLVGDATFSLLPKGDHYALRMRMPYEGVDPNQGTAMQSAALAMSIGRSINWSVSAPRILTTNGRVSGQTATHSTPLADLFQQGGGEIQFDVEFGL